LIERLFGVCIRIQLVLGFAFSGSVIGQTSAESRLQRGAKSRQVCLITQIRIQGSDWRPVDVYESFAGPFQRKRALAVRGNGASPSCS
jgi:hypothetical protein